MALAQRLNELAVANSQGLLNDDEYRLLRQNLFEQHSGSVMLPMENPVVPIARVHVQLRATTPAPAPSPRRPPPRYTPEPARPPPSPSRPKAVVTTGMASLIRRATGRKTPTPTNDPPTTKHPRKGSGANHVPTPNEPPTPKLSALFPRMLHKKPADIPPLRTNANSPSRTSRNVPSATAAHTEAIYHASDYGAPISPSSSNFSGSLISPTYPEKTFSSIRDVFDDDNLHTVKEIRSAIIATEDEGQRLIEAFDNLEASTVRRIQKQRARRLPTTTPANVNVLLEGREWRQHRLVTSPSSPRLDTRTHSHHRHIISSPESNGSDVASIRSASSNYTSLSQSKSIPSLPKHPASPLSAHFRMPTIMRKNSISSVSSHTPSVAPSSGTLGVNSHAHGHALSRSTSQLGLGRLKGSSALASSETVGGGGGGADGVEDFNDAELSDIRKRREDVVARYKSRVEFLRARLKGAELHEKLLRK